VPSTSVNGPIRLVVEHTSDVTRSARVLQISSLFDVPMTEKTHQRWDVDLPLHERDWNIGIIVGPSGAGKSSVARAAFGDAMLGQQEWSRNRSLLDDFPQGMGIRDVVALLSAVGFNSPPAWMRPFHTLSNGEQFRVSCARALADTHGLVAIDEFTSVVDRQVAQVASHTVQKTVRKHGRQLVAISCHFDIIDWLQPDWIYQPHGAEFTWRSVQPRPCVELAIHRVGRAAWPLFSHHHYLSASLVSNAKCFGAFLPDGRCVAFASYRHLPHPTTKNMEMAHRFVVLPDWQGLGIGGRLAVWVGQHLADCGYRFRYISAHPAVINGFRRSPRWQEIKTTAEAADRSRRSSSMNANASLSRLQADPRRMLTKTFEYRPPAPA
jgi:ABC-type ATPase involved in cell division